MDAETLEQLAAELERHRLGRRQPPLGPYLDAACEAMYEVGVDKVHVMYIDVGSCRNRHNPPRYEPAGVPVPEALSRLVLAVADRCVPPPQPHRHIPWSRDEVVTIDPRQRPRARLFREGVKTLEIEVSARDDPEWVELNRALRTCVAAEVKAVFEHRCDGHATVDRVEITPKAVVVPAELGERIGVWVTRVVERQPLDLPMLFAGGFVLIEVEKDVATLHHRTCRMFATDRSID